MTKLLTHVHHSQWWIFIGFLIYVTTVIIYPIKLHYNLDLSATSSILIQLTIISNIYAIMLTEYLRKIRFLAINLIASIIIFLQMTAVLDGLKLHQILGIYVIYAFIDLLATIHYDPYNEF